MSDRMNFSLKRLGKRLAVRSLGGGRIPRAFHLKVVPSHFTILMYHGVAAKPLSVSHSCFIDRTAFREQIEYLNRHCQLLSLERAIRSAQNGDIDRPTVVLTFDDGFQNNFDVAFPILKEFSAPATIFLTTSYVGTDDTLWYCRLHRALQMTHRCSLEWRGNDLALDSTGARAKASRFIAQELKDCSHDRLRSELDRILVALDGDPDEPVPRDSPFRMLDREAIEDMEDSGLVSFGAHTDSHAILSRVLNSVKHEEIEHSLESVTELTGQRCRHFAYPNGQQQDYDQETISILRNAGVEAAVTTIAGGNTERTPRFEMRRYAVGPATDLNAFRLRVHHLLPYLRSTLEKASGR